MTMAQNFKRMRISEFRKTFSGRPPSINTIRKWIDEEMVCGDIVGSTYFVHVDSDGQLLKPTQPNSVDGLLAKIINP